MLRNPIPEAGGLRRWLTLSALIAVALLASLAGTALAATNTASLSVGPVPLGEPVPVKACVDSTCVETPELSAVKLDVTATITTDGVLPPAPPVITVASCPAGQQGVAVTVTTPETGTLTVSATVSGTLPTGDSFSETIGPVTIPAVAGSSTTVSACTTLLT